MLVIHVYSSIMPCSSHYQPCCSYYASTSSALIKINALRYHFMFPVLLIACLNTETQVHCTEPICCMVVVWEFSFLFLPSLLSLSLSLSLCKSISTGFPGCSTYFFSFNIKSCLLGSCYKWNTGLRDLSQFERCRKITATNVFSGCP